MLDQPERRINLGSVTTVGVVIVMNLVSLGNLSPIIQQNNHGVQNFKMFAAIPEDRSIILPPKFPDKAPYGWHGSALLCHWLVGPKAPFHLNRACAGPVPPFRKPKKMNITMAASSPRTPTKDLMMNFEDVPSEEFVSSESEPYNEQEYHNEDFEDGNYYNNNEDEDDEDDYYKDFYF